MTPEQEARLAARASTIRVTVSRLLVESALADKGETASDRAHLATSMFGAYRMLAALSNNINQIARATNASHEVQSDCASALVAVRTSAVRINALLERYDAH
ncbi:plasmid mobilization relaxosome protein MobC [Williamsia sp.]|uniref:plasmid mobilization relaxosome protein MobC n=1 Tax=Williamsia sp. TaxID=1872085 RepID=UPI0025E954F2|nr:plasmid mobilization relaxosome protein MobC [Williamsia sp.]